VGKFVTNGIDSLAASDVSGFLMNCEIRQLYKLLNCIKAAK